MKTFIIQEKFTGYAEVTIEANTDDEALSLYKKSDISDISKFSMNTSITPISIKEQNNENNYIN